MREDGALPALGPPPEESPEGRGGGRAVPLLRPGMNCIKIRLPGKLILSNKKGLCEVIFS